MYVLQHAQLRDARARLHVRVEADLTQARVQRRRVAARQRRKRVVCVQLAEMRRQTVDRAHRARHHDNWAAHQDVVPRHALLCLQVACLRRRRTCRGIVHGLHLGKLGEEGDQLRKWLRDVHELERVAAQPQRRVVARIVRIALVKCLHRKVDQLVALNRQQVRKVCLAALALALVAQRQRTEPRSKAHCRAAQQQSNGRSRERQRAQQRAVVVQAHADRRQLHLQPELGPRRRRGWRLRLSGRLLWLVAARKRAQDPVVYSQHRHPRHHDIDCRQFHVDMLLDAAVRLKVRRV